MSSFCLLSTIEPHINENWEEYIPTTLVVGMAVSFLALSILAKKTFHLCQGHVGETWRGMMGRLALEIPQVKKIYDKKIEEMLIHFKGSVRKKWEPFGKAQTSIPNEGWSSLRLWNLLMSYNQIILKKIEKENLSGTIYAPISTQLDRVLESIKTELDSIDLNSTDDRTYFTSLSKKLSLLFTAGSAISYWWNSLHLNEFPIGSFLNYQVVQMVGRMFGAAKIGGEIMGTITSGGTESLMLAMRAYRNWAMDAKGHREGQSVVLCCKTVHAAILKAGIAYCIKIVLIDEDKTGKIDLYKLNKALKSHKDNVIAIVASTPCYPTGVVDPIEEIAKLAVQYKCGLHVDCCLGGFVINNLPQFSTGYLGMAGVTSLSADTHKNGFAPKGSSVILTKRLPDDSSNLLERSYYLLADWEGGAYPSIKDAGSEPCTPVLNTYLTLLTVGAEGYEQMLLTLLMISYAF